MILCDAAIGIITIAIQLTRKKSGLVGGKNSYPIFLKLWYENPPCPFVKEELPQSLFQTF